MKPSKLKRGKGKVEYWKHAKWMKRVFWKAERKAAKTVLRLLGRME